MAVGVGGGSGRVGLGYVGSRSGVFFFGVGVVGFGRIRGLTSDEQELYDGEIVDVFWRKYGGNSGNGGKVG